MKGIKVMKQDLGPYRNSAKDEAEAEKTEEIVHTWEEMDFRLGIGCRFEVWHDLTKKNHMGFYPRIKKNYLIVNNQSILLSDEQMAQLACVLNKKYYK